jgi:hypothetical protein
VSALLIALALASTDPNALTYSDAQACVVTVEDYALGMSYEEDEPLTVGAAVCSEYRVYYACDDASHDSPYANGCTNLVYTGSARR